MVKQKRYGKSGWFKESRRHSLARRGIKTGRKINYYTPTYVVGDLPKIAVSGVGTLGASAVSWIPTLVTLGVAKKVVKDIKGMTKKRKGKTNYAKDNDWEKMSIEKQDEIADKFFKERDLFAWNDDGSLTKEFSNYLSEEGYKDVPKGKINYSNGDFSKHPQFIGNAPLADQDKDSVPDVYDWDKDGDGVPNWDDDEGLGDFFTEHSGAFDPDFNKVRDTDFDGVPDYKDLHPRNPNKGVDWSLAKPKTVKGKKAKKSDIVFYVDKDGNKKWKWRTKKGAIWGK